MKLSNPKSKQKKIVHTAYVPKTETSLLTALNRKLISYLTELITVVEFKSSVRVISTSEQYFCFFLFGF